MRQVRLHYALLFTLPTLWSQIGVAHEKGESIMPEAQAFLLSAGAKMNGPVPASERINLTLSFPLRNEVALNRFIEEINDPKSPHYHQYITPESFASAYGLPDVDYQRAVQWAQTQKLQVLATPKNHMSLSLSGEARAIESAFNIKFYQYSLPASNSSTEQIVYVADRQPTVTLDVPVEHIYGLDNIDRARAFHKLSSQMALTNNAPSGSGPEGNFIPSDMRNAYYGDGPLTGKGQTVAVISYGSLQNDDIDIFYTGIKTKKPNVPITKVYINNFDDKSSAAKNNADESLLDVVNVLGMAPGLKELIFYASASKDAQALLDRVASDNKASIITSSFNAPNDFSKTYKEFQAQGQTFIQASGDDGAYDNYSWDRPLGNPEITIVGGTHLTTDKPGGVWKSESGWPKSGGGYYPCSITSACQDPVQKYLIPAYQKNNAVINKNNKASDIYRNAPDIAMEADDDNVGVEQGKLVLNRGGTSYAAPRFAGLMALANEAAAQKGGKRIGFINPHLYTIGASSRAVQSFHDIVSGTNPAGDRISSPDTPEYSAVKGFDLVTGWGTPVGASLIEALINP